MKRATLYTTRTVRTALLLCACASGYLRAQDAPPADSAAMSGSVLVEASDTLTGPLPKILYADQGPYFVLGDVVVPQGQTVIIEAGTVMLFNAFTGIKVLGTLLARGESDKPIVFTSVNDQAHNPASQLHAAPYDWNGVQVSADGIGTHFSYCVIRYSVYGISSMTRYIRIGPTLFQNNGRASLTIDGVEHQTGDSPYEYNSTVPLPTAGSDSLMVLPDPRARTRTIVRYSSLGVALLGTILSSVYTARFSQSDEDLEALSSTGASNLAEHTSDQWDIAYDRARRDRAGMVWGFVIGIAGAAGFTWTFFF
jgi:hypothetical protein